MSILKKITLRKLNLKKDISKKYLNWMNDLEIHKYTEQKYTKHSLTNLRKFVREKNKSKNEFLYGIFLKKKQNQKMILKDQHQLKILVKLQL